MNIKTFLPLLFLSTFACASYFADAMRAYKTGNYTEAKRLFETALEEDGAEQAQFFLGLLYLKGEGVEQSVTTAKRFLSKAAELGNARAKCFLAEAYMLQSKPDKQSAFKLLKEGRSGGAEECSTIAAKYNIPL